MGVMFKTQQGRTLYNEELSPQDITAACGALVEVVGFERGDVAETVIHVHTRHIVEWWQPDWEASDA